MSYEHGTSHYNLPQTVGSDTRDWFDTNEAFADIDAAIYSAGQTAEAAMTDLTEVKGDVQGLKDADIAMTGRVDGIESRVSTSELKIDRLENTVADDKQDLMDAICSIEEASATAAYAHATGEFFWYNNTLYKATTNIAIGQQIVPDTNCQTTNITTELLSGGGGGAEIDDSVVSATKVWSSYKTNAEIEKVNAGDTRFNATTQKLEYYDGTQWNEVPQTGGVGMMSLDYSKVQSLSGAGGTSSYDGVLLVTGGTHNTSTRGTISINNVIVAEEPWNDAGPAYTWDNFWIPVNEGDVVALTNTSCKIISYK